MSVSELFSLCMNRRAWFSGECYYEISFNCMPSMNLVKLCPCVTEIVLVQFVFLMAWRYENRSVKSSFILQLCYTWLGKKKVYIFSHYCQHTWGVLLIVSSPSYEAVEAFPCFLPFVHRFMRTKLFYRNMVRDLHSTLILFFSWEIFFLFCLFSETEDSERPYSPHEPEEETNEIERQRSKSQDTTVQSRPRTHQPSASTGTDDSEKNEVISTQQMCKEFTWFASDQKNWIF